VFREARHSAQRGESGSRIGETSAGAVKRIINEFRETFAGALEERAILTSSDLLIYKFRFLMIVIADNCKCNKFYNTLKRADPEYEKIVDDRAFEPLNLFVALWDGWLVLYALEMYQLNSFLRSMVMESRQDIAHGCRNARRAC
jgi:hypothetical protein